MLIGKEKKKKVNLSEPLPLSLESFQPSPRSPFSTYSFSSWQMIRADDKEEGAVNCV